MDRIVTNQYQEEKQCNPLDERHHDGSNFRGDVRFRDYSVALKAGQLDVCEDLRHKHRRDREFLTKCDTLERMWINEMALYVREVQIANRERDGYRDLARGWEKKFTKEQGGPSANALIKRGKAVIAQAIKARREHTNPEIQSDFPPPV